jgi:YVTN family beta-propeller protein
MSGVWSRRVLMPMRDRRTAMAKRGARSALPPHRSLVQVTGSIAIGLLLGIPLASSVIAPSIGQPAPGGSPPADATVRVDAGSPLSTSPSKSGSVAPYDAPKTGTASPPNLPGTDRRGYYYDTLALPVEAGTPTWLAYDNADESFYVAETNGTVDVIPAGSISIAHTIAVNDTPFGVAYDPVDGRLFVADSGSDQLSVISDSTNTSIGSVAVGSEPLGVAYDGASGRVYVTNYGSSTVTAIDARTLAAVGNYSVGLDPVGIAFDPVSGLLFVANEGSSNVSVLSSSSSTPVASLPAGTDPFGVVADNSTGEVYVSDVGSANVSVFDANGSGSLASVPTGGTPEGLAYDPADQSIWVANGRASVVVINATANRMVQAWALDPLGAAYASQSNEICVTNAANATFQCLVPGDGRYQGAVNVTFSETGLAPGVRWGVNLAEDPDFPSFDGTSNTSTLGLPVDDHAYATYSVVPIPGYDVTPSTGGFTLNGVAVNVSITFRLDPNNFTVTFRETGLVIDPLENLNGPLDWGVDVSQSSFLTDGTSLTLPEVNGTYNYSVLSTPDFGSPAGGHFTIAGANAVVALHYSPVGYAVTFESSGLNEDQAWTVSLNGTPETSELASISFSVPAGEYSYSVTPIAGVYLASYSGVVAVTNTAIAVPLSWSPWTSNVTFHEIGLPGGTNWSIELGDASYASAGTSTIVVHYPNATYFLGVTPIQGWTVCCPGNSITVEGSPVYENLTWTHLPYLYAATFDESGLPQGSNWSGYLFGTYGNTLSTTGSSLTFEVENGTFEFVPGYVAGWTAGVSGRTLTIDGGPSSQTIAWSPTLFEVSFTAVGLEAGAEWSVNLSGEVRSTSGPSLTFSEPNGTFDYSVTAPGSYSATPFLGSITVNGASVPQGVTFTLIGTGPASHGGGSSNFSSIEAYEIASGLVIAILAGCLLVMGLRRRGGGPSRIGNPEPRALGGTAPSPDQPRPPAQ